MQGYLTLAREADHMMDGRTLCASEGIQGAKLGVVIGVATDLG